MRTHVASCASKKVIKAVAAVLLAGASAACSTDSSRFGESPFTNPFSTASTPQIDKTATGSIPSRIAPIGKVSSNPLNPVQTASAPQALPRVASSTLQQASPVTGSAAGWSATGGTPVSVGTGETASTLSARYGVPAAAILAANGGQIRSGQQAIIPAYTGNAATAPKVAAVEAPKPPQPISAPVQPQPAKVAPPKLAAARSVAPNKAAVGVKPAEDDGDKPGKIIAAAPAKPLAAKPLAAKPQPAKSVIAAAKPLKPAMPSKPAAADDDEDEAPAKSAKAAAPASAQEKPAVAQAQRPAPRVIAMTPQKPVKEAEPDAKAAAVEKVDTTTTAAIPAAKPLAADDKPDFRWPARGRVISGFGSKGGNGDGIAISVPEGTPVKAAGDGVVAYAGEELKGYGKLVLIRHDNGFVSAYAHNGELNVKRGEKVSRGQMLAKSGSTGNVTSPQLHFELRKGSTPVDPTKYLDN